MLTSSLFRDLCSTHISQSATSGTSSKLVLRLSHKVPSQEHSILLYAESNNLLAFLVMSAAACFFVAEEVSSADVVERLFQQPQMWYREGVLSIWGATRRQCSSHGLYLLLGVLSNA